MWIFRQHCRVGSQDTIAASSRGVHTNCPVDVIGCVVLRRRCCQIARYQSPFPKDELPSTRREHPLALLSTGPSFYCILSSTIFLNNKQAWDGTEVESASCEDPARAALLCWHGRYLDKRPSPLPLAPQSHSSNCGPSSSASTHYISLPLTSHLYLCTTSSVFCLQRTVKQRCTARCPRRSH